MWTKKTKTYPLPWLYITATATATAAAAAEAADVTATRRLALRRMMGNQWEFLGAILLGSLSNLSVCSSLQLLGWGFKCKGRGFRCVVVAVTTDAPSVPNSAAAFTSLNISVSGMQLSSAFNGLSPNSSSTGGNLMCLLSIRMIFLIWHVAAKKHPGSRFLRVHLERWPWMTLST